MSAPVRSKGWSLPEQSFDDLADSYDIDGGVPESNEECPHEFGALGAVSGDYCIHCGAKLSDFKGSKA